MVAAGITPGLIRILVGLENVEDIIDDVKQGLEQIQQLNDLYLDKKSVIG